MPNVNWDAVVDSTAEQGLDLLKDLLEGSKEDLKTFGKDISRDAIEAIQMGKPELLDQLTDQVRLLGETNRIRVVGTTWVFVGNVFKSLSGLAVKVATGAISLT